jgi:hypothetical protein
MSKPILALQNTANWQSLWSTSLAAVQLANGSFVPMNPIVVPYLLETDIIAISVSATTAKPSWRVAGNVAKKIATGITTPGGAPDTTISDRRLLWFNQLNLYRFARLTDTYALEITPKWWIKDIQLDIFIYTGVDTDTVTEQLNRIELTVDAINR